MCYQSLLGPRSRWFSYLQSLPRETVDIALFWGANDIVETRTCTCSTHGCLNTNENLGASDKRQQVTPSQCPWCVWLHDNQDAREWLKVTEIDREQAGLMVSPISLCLVLSSSSPHLLSSFFLFAWFLRHPVGCWDLSYPCQLLIIAMSIYSSPSFRPSPLTFITS